MVICFTLRLGAPDSLATIASLTQPQEAPRSESLDSEDDGPESSDDKILLPLHGKPSLVKELVPSDTETPLKPSQPRGPKDADTGDTWQEALEFPEVDRGQISESDDDVFEEAVERLEDKQSSRLMRRHAGMKQSLDDKEQSKDKPDSAVPSKDKPSKDKPDSAVPSKDKPSKDKPDSAVPSKDKPSKARLSCPI